jgi:hypothetical protein
MYNGFVHYEVMSAAYEDVYTVMLSTLQTMSHKTLSYLIVNISLR